MLRQTTETRTPDQNEAMRQALQRLTKPRSRPQSVLRKADSALQQAAARATGRKGMRFSRQDRADLSQIEDRRGGKA